MYRLAIIQVIQKHRHKVKLLKQKEEEEKKHIKTKEQKLSWTQCLKFIMANMPKLSNLIKPLVLTTGLLSLRSWLSRAGYKCLLKDIYSSFNWGETRTFEHPSSLSSFVIFDFYFYSGPASIISTHQMPSVGKNDFGQ